MVVTRKDVTKQLAFDDGPQSGTSGGLAMGVPPKTRPKRTSQPPQRTTEVFDIGRCNSAEFSALLGEGSSTKAIEKSKELALQKKKVEALRVQSLMNLNDRVLNTDTISPASDHDSAEEATKETSPGNNKEASGNSSKDLIEDSQAVNLNDVEETPPATETRQDLLEVNQADNLNNDRIHRDSSSQTEKCLVLCTCVKCQGIIQNFSMMLKNGKSPICEFSSQEEQASFLSNTAEQEEEFIPLFKGCKVKVSVTTKGKLKGISSNEPKDYVTVLMDSFFSNVEMANMTAAGRTKDSIKMKPELKDAILVYILNKFPDMDEQKLNTLINNKCYAERRKCWVGGTEGVRKPLQKKRRDPTKPRKESTTGKKKKVKTGRSKKSKDKAKKHERKLEEKEDRDKLKRKHKSQDVNKRRKNLTPVKSKSLSKGHTKKKTSNRSPWKEQAIEPLPAEKRKLPQPSRPVTGGKRPKSDEELRALMRAAKDSDDEFETSTPKRIKTGNNTNIAEEEPEDEHDEESGNDSEEDSEDTSEDDSKDSNEDESEGSQCES